MAVADDGTAFVRETERPRKRSLFGDPNQQQVKRESARKDRRPPTSMAEQRKLVPVSFEEMQAAMKAKKVKLVPAGEAAKIIPSTVESNA